MAAKEMYDYLDIVAPDYSTTTLSVSPQRVFTEWGEKNQVVHLFDDGSERGISLSDDSIFTVRLQWADISEADAGTIVDFFHDTSKANGITRSFKWDHPTDEHTYVVKFRSALPRSIYVEGSHGITEVDLKVVGRIAD